ncbi:MAG: Hsp20/alpha crystallin family protein [Actinomycetota bacterium]|nr:MAG: Hsp20/alpha crystallin family protein [Actinomycetota bacterium]
MLMRSDPFRDLDRLAQQFWGTSARPAGMPLQAYRKGDHLIAEFDLPGVSPESIDITVEKNMLSVRAERLRVDVEGDDVEMISDERQYGTFTRQLFLGETLDTDHIEADYADGVLLVKIPVAESAKPRKVQINADKKRTAINA